MQWSERYDGNHKPSYDNISEFIGNDLWNELNLYLQEAYNIQPNVTYSKCSAQKGWNIKYRKGGKSLCTLYPMQGYFIALVVIGAKEMAEADLLLPLCSQYTQNLYQQTEFSLGGKWMMVNVTKADILHDVKKLIGLRVKPNRFIS